MSVDGKMEIIHRFKSMDDVTLAYINYLWERNQFHERYAIQASALPTSRREEELLAKNVALEQENCELRQENLALIQALQVRG